MVVDAKTQWRVGVSSKLALLIDENWTDNADQTRIREFVGVVKRVVNEEQAIKIRAALLLGWANGRDLQEAGYPSWRSFVEEHSPWSVGHTNALVGLAQGQLVVIKEAVERNELELTVALRAPAKLRNDSSPEAQRQWIRSAQLYEIPERHRALMDVLSGTEMHRVLKARRLAAILIGGDAPPSVIDDFLIECHAQKLTSDQILERARAAPPMPQRLGRGVPEWKSEFSDSLLGPWVEPADINDAVTKLRVTVWLLDQRRMLLAMAYSLIRSHQLWTGFPECSTLEEFCVLHLGISQRTLQRWADEGLDYFEHPRLRKEIEEGRLTVDRAKLAADHARSNPASLDEWIELLRRIGRVELHHAQQRVGNLRTYYAPALAMVREVEAVIRREKDRESTEISRTASRIADHLQAVGATGPLPIAVRDDRNNHRSREPAYIFAPPKLLAAADYVLETVVLPPVYGPRRMVEHDRYTCQNPRCRRTTLRVHPHHIHQQQHGGTDDPANIVTVCPACHLRGLHSGQMSVVRIDDWLVWTWPDTSAVIMDSRVSELVYERRVSPPRRAPVSGRPPDPSDPRSRPTAAPADH